MRGLGFTISHGTKTDRIPEDVRLLSSEYEVILKLAPKKDKDERKKRDLQN